MVTQSDTFAEVSQCERIWFFPNKFWAATKGMPEEEVSKLMEEVESLAAAKDTQALRKYPFIFVGDPYRNTAA